MLVTFTGLFILFMVYITWVVYDHCRVREVQPQDVVTARDLDVIVAVLKDLNASIKRIHP